MKASNNSQEMKVNKPATLYKKIGNLLKSGKQPVVTFYLSDGRRQVQSLSHQFLQDEFGNRRNLKKVAKDIHAISHDLNAVKFIV